MDLKLFATVFSTIFIAELGERMSRRLGIGRRFHSRGLGVDVVLDDCGRNDGRFGVDRVCLDGRARYFAERSRGRCRDTRL